MAETTRTQRVELIQAIQKCRDSYLITYVTSDRPGATVQMASDAVRYMYNHVLPLGFAKAQRIDLFLYSRGGFVDVPWPLVTMLREYCDELNVLVPYRAHSAATVIALGADHIVMGRKGELGPIDPIISRRLDQGDKTGAQEQMSVEDIMAFVDFLKERVGLGDQAALASSMCILIEKLTPWMLGSVYRTHSHNRLIARKLLASHAKPLDERQIDIIIESLAEKMYFHGHAIGRREAEAIGLPVECPPAEMEQAMWGLFEAYERMMKFNDPVDLAAVIPPGQDEGKEPIIVACVESEDRFDACRGNLVARRVRQAIPQLNLNVNLALNVPPGIKLEELPQAAQQQLNVLLQQAQAQMAALIRAELAKQAPIERTEANLQSGRWQDLTTEGI